jgi:argininosuccinate lyase
VTALHRGGIIEDAAAQALRDALWTVAREIDTGPFAAFAGDCDAEDIHGAIDARVRELTPFGDTLHAGRSRNDQVATTLLLYCRDRAQRLNALAIRLAAYLCDVAEREMQCRTLLAGATHWQPAQPVLLGFWLAAAAEPFVRDAERLDEVARASKRSCPLGSGALAGSSLPLDRAAAAAELGFAAPSRNAMDAIGNRDVALDLAHAAVRAMVNASRICEEFVLWTAPAFGYIRLGDAASTGSSLMPQKRNPDPFELVRATAGDLAGRFSGALASTCGVALSYHRDLQITKSAVVAIVERAHAALDAFASAITHVEFQRDRMSSRAGDGYTVATDVADALIAGGLPARAAHHAVGTMVSNAEMQGRNLDPSDLETIEAQRGLSAVSAPLDAHTSVLAKTTFGSTHPDAVARSLAGLRRAIEEARA